jgi:DNA repair protein RadC
MTAQIRDAGAVLGVTLHDHLIIGRAREVSFRSDGLL